MTDANAVLAQMGKPGELYFITQKGSDGTDNYTSTLALSEDGTTIVYDYVLNKTIEELEEGLSFFLEYGFVVVSVETLGENAADPEHQPG